MSLDKAIKYGKEKRKKYYDSDSRSNYCSCRNHGSCDWCKSGRLHQAIRVDEATKKELEEYYGSI